MILKMFFGGLLAIFFLIPLHSQASPPPDPHALLLAVREQQLAQQESLHARLRGKTHSTFFRIIWDKGTIRYEFSHPEQIVFLRLGDKSAEIWEKASKASASSITRFDQRVRGTAVTYEDLAFRFLYWPNPILVGEDRVNTRASWTLQVKSPDRSSRYATVRIWIDKESHSLLRMEAFDFHGHSLKRFEVISAQKVRGRWFLKEMRIEERDSLTGKVLDRNYLTILSK